MEKMEDVSQQQFLKMFTEYKDMSFWCLSPQKVRTNTIKKYLCETS